MEVLEALDQFAVDPPTRKEIGAELFAQQGIGSRLLVVKIWSKWGCARRRKAREGREVGVYLEEELVG